MHAKGKGWENEGGKIGPRFTAPSMPGPSNKKKKQKEKKSKKEKEVAPGGEEQVGFEPPFIHDPGNGPRVRDVKAFLGSSFAQPVTSEKLGQKEVLEKLLKVLPEETAQVGGRMRVAHNINDWYAKILWYNKSRLKSRICPCCLRLYNIGDKLADLLDTSGEEMTDRPVQSVRQLREQELSGICGSVFLLNIKWLTMQVHRFASLWLQWTLEGR